MTEAAANAPLLTTMGEPSGVGGELALKAWLRRREDKLPPFCIIADAGWLTTMADALGWAVSVKTIDHPSQAASVFDRVLPVLQQDLTVTPAPGQPDPANGAAVIAAIETGFRLVAEGQAGGLVTNPIHKHVLHQAGFSHPGHTEFLGALDGMSDEPVMMLACPALRVVPVTVHVGLAEAVNSLDTALIVRKARITHQALTKDFGIDHPRLAVAGLNPHAGESGSMGLEDRDIIAPAVAALQREGIDARGPLAADTMFHPAARESYDAAICMYHDQALIPIKTLDFAHGVNITLGLSIIRTSPDHGTALDLAGTGTADARSLQAALRMASDMAAMRARRP